MVRVVQPGWRQTLTTSALAVGVAFCSLLARGGTVGLVEFVFVLGLVFVVFGLVGIRQVGHEDSSERAKARRQGGPL